MNEDLPNKDRERGEAVVPISYLRSTAVGTKISMGALLTLCGLLVTSFGMLVANHRDAQHALAANFQTYGDANQKQHEQLWDRLQSIEFLLCAKFPNWKRCRG